MTSGAAGALDVVEELTLGVIGDLPPFDRGGRVGAFEAGGEGTGFFGALLAVFWRDWSWFPFSFRP